MIYQYFLLFFFISKSFKQEVSYTVSFYFIPIRYVQDRVIAPVTTHTQSFAFSWMKFHMARDSAYMLVIFNNIGITLKNSPTYF